MRRWWALMTGAVMGVIGSLPGPAVAGQSEPEPAGDLSRFESATVVSGLSVVVERPDGQLVAERDTTYTIGVRNQGEAPQTVRLRVTVPPWMPEVTPRDGGELAGGYVEWPVTLGPGEVAIRRLTGEYASPGQDAPTRTAFTACAVAERNDRPIVCATDVARLEPARSGARWWLAVLAVALAGAAGAVLVLRGRRRARIRTPAADAPEPADQSGS